jgi:primosomal protein N' (replication factor Y)
LISYADVVVDIPMDNETLTYIIPDKFNLALRGERVEIEIRSRKAIGIIKEIHFNEPNFKTKNLIRVIDSAPILNEDQWDLADWMKKTYLAGLGESLFRMIPQGRRLIKENEPNLEVDSSYKELNSEQNNAYKGIISKLEQNASTHLIYGITGSGKTEIYIHLIREVLKRTNRSVIFLVPEITLTYHILKKLETIFPKELALIHSGLKISQRFRAYQGLLKGEKRIAVGTRSAIFAPVSNLGLVIMDEEHDSSYKENSSPRYHAKQIAHYRITKSSGMLVLGSATPSIETFYLAKSNKIHFYEIKKRAVISANLPEIKIISKKDSEGPIGFELLQALKIQAIKKEQSILLLNRRGYAPFIYSSDESKILGCPNCSTNLCYHKNGIVQCHICGYKESFEKLKVQHKKLELIGSGTQKLEEYLLSVFPDSKIERLDQDSSKNQEILSGILTKLYNGELDILTGTQMIAKGLDVPNVTLVGVINANQGLGIPDFRANERVFSLLTQVSGRAGRSEKKGLVLIEAHDPKHPVFQKALNQDYDGFYNDEIQFRREMNLPPFVRLLRLVIRSTDEEISNKEILKISEIIKGRIEEKMTVLGPSPCPFYKIDKYFRNHILIKTDNHDKTRKLVQAIQEKWKASAKVYLEIDFDPLDLI